MRTPCISLRRWLRLGTALSLAFALQIPAALAQEADSGAAPPTRVGQINALSGSVSFNGPGTGGWAAAAANYPISAGDTLYTQSGARAGIALGASQITLAGNTELEVTDLTDQNFAATAAQGEIAFTLDDLQPGQSDVFTTPRGSVTITQDGTYAIQAGDADTPTVVNVYQGAATLASPGAQLQVGPGQAAIVSGSGTITAQLGAAQQDAFTETALAQRAPIPPSCPASVCGQMSGIGELGQYGSWQQTPQYGAVWYPAVASGWTPYREGHWVFIQPWGWTWVESEPWGFAPFHYGRWIQEDDRWGWAPAPYAGSGYTEAVQPAYAPAVVAFFGLAAGAITAAALASHSVGWVPLGPDEPYYPPYHAPPAYIRRINIVNVHNVNIVHVTNNYYGAGFTPERLANHPGATFVPAAVMARGEPIQANAHRLPPQAFAAARPVAPGFEHPGGSEGAFHLPQGEPLAHLRPGAAPPRAAFIAPQGSYGLAPPQGSFGAAPPHGAYSAAPPHGSYGAGTPFAPHPAGSPMAPQLDRMPQAEPRPAYATPGFHPPPRPEAGQPPGMLPPAPGFHPQAEQHVPAASQPPAQPFHRPQPEGFPHQPMPQPQPPFEPHAAPPVFHPPAPPVFHPAAPPVFHPAAPAAPQFHPAPQTFHPAEPPIPSHAAEPHVPSHVPSHGGPAPNGEGEPHHP